MSASITWIILWDNCLFQYGLFQIVINASAYSKWEFELHMFDMYLG